MELYLDPVRFFAELRQARPRCDAALIRRAWELARTAHAHQQREGGEPYFSHPVSVAYFLFQVESDTATLAAALLHDVIEDTKITARQIAQATTPEVATLVEGVTKLAVLDLPPAQVWTQERYRRENLSRLFVSIANDPRVAMIKLADHLHNLATLGSLSTERRRRMAQESLDVFAPLAEALGLGGFQARIQELAFEQLDPETFADLARKIAERQPEFETLAGLAVTLIETALARAEVPALVSARPKEIYRLYRKLTTLGLEFDEAFDVVELRIIVPNEEDCYRARRVVDELGREVQSTDLSGRPRGLLGYQSRHKVMLAAPGGTVLDIQIRTEEMHRQAEMGAATRWTVQPGPNGDAANAPRHGDGLRETLKGLSDALASLNADAPESSLAELVDTIREDGLAPRLEVFSPRGALLSLPVGATPIDFAYYIHTELGHECVGALVNGQPVSLGYELRAGDTVEILKRKGEHPKLYWLLEGRAKSTRAQQKIRQYFRTQERPRFVAYGRDVVRKNLGNVRAFVPPEELLEALVHALAPGDETEEALDLAVAEGRISLDRLKSTIGRLVVEHYLVKARLSRDALGELLDWFCTASSTPLRREADLCLAITRGTISPEALGRGIHELVAGGSARTSGDTASVHRGAPAVDPPAPIRMAECCFPVPGEPIVGYVTVGKGLAIHRADCPTLLDSHRLSHTLKLDWSSLQLPSATVFSAEFLALLSDSDSETFRQLQKTVLVAGGVIRTFMPLGVSKQGLTQLRLVVDVRDIAHLHHVREQLAQLPDVAHIRRVGD